MLSSAILLFVALGVTGVWAWSGVRLRAAATARREAFLRIAGQSYREGIDRRDFEALHRSDDLAASALRENCDDPGTRQQVLLFAGPEAYEEGRMADAAHFLQRAHGLGELRSEDVRKAARATFAAGAFAGAEGFYRSCLAESPHPDLQDEIKLVRAYRDAERIPWVSYQTLLTDLEGLPAALLVASRTISGSDPRSCELAVVGLTSGGDSMKWTPPGCQSVRAFAAGDLNGQNGADLVVAGPAGQVFVAFGPFSIDSNPVWIPLPDPTSEAGYCEFQTQLAVVPAQDPAPAQVVIGRRRILGRLVFDAATPGSPPRKDTEPVGSDITLVRAANWGKLPAILLGLGAWQRYGFELRLLGPGSGARSVASIMMGYPQDAAVYPDLEFSGRAGGPSHVFLAVPGGMHWARNQIAFGDSTNPGWEFGLHALKLDPQTRSLAPLAMVAMPRPKHAGARLFVIDLLGDARPEITLSVGIPLPDAPELGLEPFTMLFEWKSDAEASLEPRLRLPGAIVAHKGTECGPLLLVTDSRTGMACLTVKR
jgi:hypothetical protein